MASALMAQPVKIDIPYTRHVLKNGLTLLVHEDRKAPIVAVNIWYHVGSKNEKIGKTGFAHLFEHLMFNGSEHYNHDYFQVLERIGATDLNGTTSNDRTNYFQNVPTSALDTVLWMESDRMGHLLGVIDKPRLDEQRGVVQNEKRQFENQPYAVAYELMYRGCYPVGHPYNWMVIGSMEDLNAASLDDVKEWFRTYYGAANATLVLAGDIDVKTAIEKVERYFGHIAAGPPVARHRAWVAKRSGVQRQTVEDRVPQARIYKVWNVPELGAPEGDMLDLVSLVLATGKSSRLYKRLVYEDQIATDVRADNDQNEIGGLFNIVATARPGGDLAEVEKAIDEEMAKFLRAGPTAEELERAKTQYMARLLRGLERIGGFGGKSDILATWQVFRGDPDYYKKQLQRAQAATLANLHNAAKEWLSDGVYVLEVHPYGTYSTLQSSVDRSKVPEPGAPPSLKLPKMQRATLSNGLKIILSERHEAPLVNFALLVDAGYAADQFSVPGTTSLAMQMLLEGTTKRNSLEISDLQERLGANLAARSNLDQSAVSLSALKMNLDASLDLYADVILNPTFPQADFARLQKQQIARIQRDKASPMGMAQRVFPVLVYGKGHAYAMPFNGSGYEATVPKITREELKKFHDTWFKASNATLLITGDTTLAEIQPKLEKLLGSWKGGTVPKKNIATVAPQPKSAVYIVDKPGAQQSMIIAGHIAPPKANPDEIAIETMNTILGGMFISRINMNLREDKHWSYGAQSVFLDARGQRPFFVYAPVQSDKTKESLVEIGKELRGILRNRPATDEELQKAKGSLTLTLPGSRETLSELQRGIEEQVRFQLPDDHWETYGGKVNAVGRQDIATAAEKVLRPDNMVWVVVGDKAKIEQGIRELNLGDVRFLDPDGNPVGN
jgi:zinc protease